MRSARITLRARLRTLGLRGLLAAAAELAGWVVLVGLIELLGQVLPAYDIAALGVLTLVVGPLGLGAAALARRGRLPLASAAGRRALGTAQALARRFSPSFEFAFRLPPGMRSRRDGTLLPWVAALAGAVVAVALAPEAIFDGLDALRHQVSFTLELVLLGLLWGSLLLVLTLALLLETQRVGVPLTMLIWVGGLALGVLLPGVAIVGALLLLTLRQHVRWARRPLAPYLFCRRGRGDVVHVLRAQTLLSRLHLLGVFALALVLALANAERFFRPGVVQGHHAFTAGLAMLAAIPALLLALRVGGHFDRLFCLGREAPESPLVPTIWWTPATPAPALVAEAAEDGWTVLTGAQHGADDYDLLEPDSGAGRGQRVDPVAPRAERAFQRRRRFHVVNRRAALRRLEALLKLARPEARRQGTGFIFCPHSWLLHSLLRDGAQGSLPVGPLFEDVFARRTRRYWGQILGGLGVDLVFWEDGVRWTDLKRVFGVAFECYDQGRMPIQERHFVGLPRVRVLLQAEDGPGREPTSRRSGLPRAPVGTGASVLVILRDRGGEPVREEVERPSDSRPVPQSA